MMFMDLQSFVETALASENSSLKESDIKIYINEFISALNKGEIRSAEKDSKGEWHANLWVKQGILLLFRFGAMTDMSVGDFSFFDKNTIPMRKFSLEDGVRIVPGGSSVREGAYLAKGVICMPPMYINIGAYIDEGAMIDSHALVGTCAQIGKNVHLSAASQIGGVLEPAGASPVVIEDGALIGGNCGVYEGVIVKERAVLASGVVINASTRIYDIVNETIIKAENGKAPIIPVGAVVVPGTRKIDSEFGNKYGLAISSPIIVKYRDEKTDAKTALEDALR
jgi:2,3,4,5-tetrahydropyridine-2-carboxylate N-succinyltransferase